MSQTWQKINNNKVLMPTCDEGNGISVANHDVCELFIIHVYVYIIFNFTMSVICTLYWFKHCSIYNHIIDIIYCWYVNI